MTAVSVAVDVPTVSPADCLALAHEVIMPFIGDNHNLETGDFPATLTVRVAHDLVATCVCAHRPCELTARRGSVPADRVPSRHEPS